MIMQLLKSKNFIVPDRVLQCIGFVLKYFLVVVFLFCNFYAFAQKDTSQVRDSRDGCFEVVIKNKDYIIRIGAVDYEDGEDVFICKDTPYIIQVRNNNAAKDSVIAESWDWTNCGCIDGNPQSFQASLMLSSKSSMKVTFIVGGKKKSMKLDFKIIDGIKVNINQTHNISNFGFDEHPESNYPFYNKNIKSKFLEKDEIDNILLKSHKNYFKTVDIVQNPTELSIISFHNKYMEFIESGTQQKDSTILSICSDSILDLAVYPKIELDINLYRLAESDDDYANYCVDYDGDGIPYESGDVKSHLASDCMTPIDSLYLPQRFECINPGLDGTLDLFRENKLFLGGINGYWYNRRDYDMTGDYDKIAYDPLDKSTLVIYASLDTMGRYRCNTKPVTLPSSWNTDRDNDGVLDSKITSTVPTNLNIPDIQNNLNTIYNKAGIHITVNDRGYDTLNYNSSSFVSNTPQETKYIHVQKYGGTEVMMSKADTITLWFIDELKTGNLLSETGNSAGRGTVDNSNTGRNSCIISSFYHLHPTQFKERTISHEIGHGVFSLFHPDDNAGVENDYLNAKVNSDEYNIMNSGQIYNCCTKKKIKEYRLRKYQWKYIRDGK